MSQLVIFHIENPNCDNEGKTATNEGYSSEKQQAIPKLQWTRRLENDSEVIRFCLPSAFYKGVPRAKHVGGAKTYRLASLTSPNGSKLFEWCRRDIGKERASSKNSAVAMPVVNAVRHFIAAKDALEKSSCWRRGLG
ncbi:hypothetical protein CEXT_473371 [Caerostris extrusa]|uniref:Uncharacterized protein n=1 Tax=Caerostris extrusa TaxID=172846 RepID=A0AAV4VDU6_CAEEX|nr:hypothetical protein CEXT_473371 [Caerostris extrusa]